MKTSSAIFSGSLLLPARAFADAERTTEYHGWGMGGMMFMMPVMFLLAIVVVLMVIFMVRRAGEFHGDLPRRTVETPLDILKKRYARGEIDRDEFERMKKDLRD